MANVVLVTDMVVGFMEDGHNLYCGDAAREIIPNVQRLIEKERAEGGSVVFICDTHDPDDLEFQMFPVHCVRGTEEPEIIPELQGYGRRSSAQAPLQRLLRYQPGRDSGGASAGARS